MAVYIDIQGAQSRESGLRGIGRYVLEFAGALERSKHAALIAGYSVNPELPLPAGVKAVIAADRIHSSDQIELAPGDVYHVTSPFETVQLDRVWPRAARADGVRLAVTLYDLIPLIYPEHYLVDPVYRARYTNRLDLLRLADRVLTISRATARDAVEKLDLPADAVAVVGTGVSERFRPPVSREAALAAVVERIPGVRPEYVLYTGALDFRKNVDALLDGYAQLAPELRARHQLLIVSRLSKREAESLSARLRSLGISRDVQVATSVNDDDLVSIYQAARLFVFPSLYEGFGLPVAEAIACGTPTITSLSSSLTEVVTEPAALFDPSDPESLRATLERALTDPELANVLANAKLDEQHSWSAVVEHSLAEYARLASEPAVRSRQRRRAAAAIVASEQSPWSGLSSAADSRSPLRVLARALLWPLRRFFDPRFAGVDAHVTEMHADLSARMDRAFGVSGELAAHGIAGAYSRSESTGAVELPFVFAAVGRLPIGSTVLDASRQDYGIAASLAALGYAVTALGDRLDAVDHPDVRVTTSTTVIAWKAARFDAVICVDAEGDETHHELVAPGGVLIFTALIRRGEDDHGRVTRLAGALVGLETRLARRLPDGSWTSAPDEPRDTERDAVVLGTAHAPVHDQALASAS